MPEHLESGARSRYSHGMDREIFADRFRRAAHRARDFAQSFLEEALPSELRFRVQLNASYDGNPLHASERVFPEDNDAFPSK